MARLLLVVDRRVWLRGKGHQLTPGVTLASAGRVQLLQDVPGKDDVPAGTEVWSPGG